jgi:hypothetical protein
MVAILGIYAVRREAARTEELLGKKRHDHNKILLVLVIRVNGSRCKRVKT